MADTKKKQPPTREPGLKKRPAIPESFKISRNISPMALILNEAESAKRVQNSNLVQEIDPVQNLNQVQNSEPVQIIEPVKNLHPAQIADPVQESQPVQPTPAIKTEPGMKVKAPIKNQPGMKSIPGLNNEPAKGFTAIPNHLLDQVFKELDHGEVVVYMRLFRLSWGFNQSTCQVAIPTLANRCNCSESTIRSSIKKLTAKGLIRVSAVLNTGAKDGGTTFEIYQEIGGAFKSEPGLNSKPGMNFTAPINLVAGQQSEPGLNIEPIKDHDHDFKNKDHHQSRMMTLYQDITGNNWTRADIVAYERIKHIAIDQIAATMRSVLQRAPQKPATLAYFVKEILSPTQANPKSRVAQERELERIIKDVRYANRHRNGYLISELCGDVKEECARQGIAYDNDLFNKLTN